MARNTGSVCRLCRREGLKLLLKGDRCFTDKCAFERRAYAPGQHGQSMRRKPTEYSMQLREKQKVKRIYGVFENQFRRYFAMAERMKGVTGENLLLLLERRLDTMVYRMGFAKSRTEARHLVKHGHFKVNDKKVDLPAYIVKQGDSVQVREKSREKAWFKEAVEGIDRRGGVPEWLMVDKDKGTGSVTAYPARDQLTMPMNEQLIVELYSK